MGKTCFFSLKMVFAILVRVLMIWNEQNSTFALQGKDTILNLYVNFLHKRCGSVVNNSLKSPGYPNSYPSDMHCVYSIPIPQGKVLNISFEDFVLEVGLFGCNYDYLKIMDGKNHTLGTYCAVISYVQVLQNNFLDRQDLG
ncbi:hypothetical protein ACROYT_G022990 [Oculina patagonica]